jgi:inward rectifier potassium channel
MLNDLRPTNNGKNRRIRFGDREIIAEGVQQNFWADFSHRCMTASWPSFIAGAAGVFIVLNAVFAFFFWLSPQSVANVPNGAFLDYLYFSIETLSTAGYGDMHPQTDYGHLVATVELFTGIFSMSLMTGLVFARFSRPNARLLFANNPVIATHEGKPTLMIRFANERHNAITSATAKLWILQNEVTKEGRPFRRFKELALIKDESPVFALTWTILHAIDEASPLNGLTSDDIGEVDIIILLTGYDESSAQTVHVRKFYQGQHIRQGHRYIDTIDQTEDGKTRVNYHLFHATEPDSFD